MTSTPRRSAWLSVLLAWAFAAPVAWADDDGWLHDFDEAVAAARQQNKDILIDFSGTDWCLPCQELWQQTLSKPEFIMLASEHFVLLDIDNLVSTPMPAGRKERYEALEKRFGIQAHPTVVLATADGLPYASTGATWHDLPSKAVVGESLPYKSTGLVEDNNHPASYWQHLQPLHERGQKFKAALAAAGGPGGLTSAGSIVDALSQLRPDFVVRFYADKLDQLRNLKPADETGYLAFIDARADLLDLQWKLHERWLAAIGKWEAGESMAPPWVKGFTPADVDQLIAKHRLRGAALQEALLARSYLEIDARQWSQALATLEEIGAIDGTPSRFEQANFVQVSIPSIEKLRDDVRAAQQFAGDPPAQLRALYNILRDGDIRCVTTTWCCNHSFTEMMHYMVAGASYGELLLKSTAPLQGEDRVKAIAKGLENIDLFSNGQTGRLVRQVLPSFAGREVARRYLPSRYAQWLPDYGEELAKYNDELRRDPNAAWALNGLAWIMATADDAKYRDGGRALELTTRLNELTEWKEPSYLDTLAAACAEQGDFASAIKWQTKAIELTKSQSLRGDFRRHLELYQANKPCRE